MTRDPLFWLALAFAVLMTWLSERGYLSKRHASVGRNAERQDAEERLGPKDEHAVPSEASADAQTPPPSSNEGKLS